MSPQPDKEVGTLEEHSRRGLYARLEQVFGSRHAQTLMSYLPSDQPSELATKTDVAELGSRLDQRMDGLDQRMDGLDQRMDRIEQRMDKFDDRLHDLHGALREQTRTFVISSISSMVALAAAAFAAGSLA
jgi:hypothetical protein